MNRTKAAGGLLTTCAILALAALLCEGLYRVGIGERNIIIIMVLAVFITSSVTDGYVCGLFAAVAGVVLYDLLITPPRLAFSITAGFFVTLGIMLSVALTVGTVTARIKRQTELAREKERQAGLLCEISRKLFSSRDEASIARYAMEYLENDLRRSVALYTSLDDQSQPGCHFRQAERDVTPDFFCSATEHAAAMTAARQKKPYQNASTCYLPALAQGEVYGVFGISCLAGPVPTSRLEFLELIVEQTAHALRVQSLAARQQEAVVMAETEKTHNSFLRGISHDLRTPLTGIIGASATFLENREELPVATQRSLVEGIQTDSKWLLSMVENVLSITKIHRKNMTIEKTEHVAEEVAGEAVALFRGRYPGIHVAVRQPNDLLLVPMDALLITQVLNNLLDNAYRYAGGINARILVEMRGKDGFAEFSVSDQGPGVRLGELPRLFQLQPLRSGRGEDALRGLGIGLSLCKEIVEAHGGWIAAHNLTGGGACFTFGLPVEIKKEPADEK